MLRVLNFIFNYIDTTLAIEKIFAEDKGIRMTTFTFGIKVFSFITEYTLGYAIIKFFQFLLSELLNKSIEDIKLAYIFFPLLFVIEMGLSKRTVWDLINFLFFLVRACIKLILFLSIDEVIVFLLS